MKDIEIKEKIANQADIPIDTLGDDELLTDLLVDSFAIVDLSIAIQEDLNVVFVQQDLMRLNTVGDLIALVKSKLELAAIGHNGPVHTGFS